MDISSPHSFSVTLSCIKVKSGKTFVCSILMALCFRNEVLSLQRIEPTRLHVLWYDTEQSDESTKDILCQRICQMTGIQQDQFPSCSSTCSMSARSLWMSVCRHRK